MHGAKQAIDGVFVSGLFIQRQQCCFRILDQLFGFFEETDQQLLPLFLIKHGHSLMLRKHDIVTKHGGELKQINQFNHRWRMTHQMQVFTQPMMQREQKL